jgi:hypothetical protein
MPTGQSRTHRAAVMYRRLYALMTGSFLPDNSFVPEGELF